jgi:hypothetical protein
MLSMVIRFAAAPSACGCWALMRLRLSDAHVGGFALQEMGKRQSAAYLPRFASGLFAMSGLPSIDTGARWPSFGRGE